MARSQAELNNFSAFSLVAYRMGYSKIIFTMRTAFGNGDDVVKAKFAWLYFLLAYVADTLISVKNSCVVYLANSCTFYSCTPAPRQFTGFEWVVLTPFAGDSLLLVFRQYVTLSGIFKGFLTITGIVFDVVSWVLFAKVSPSFFHFLRLWEIN